jgi:hypothetical protein
LKPWFDNSKEEEHYRTRDKKGGCMYIIIIVPVFLYGRETWSLTLKEKHRLRVFENRVLRRMFGPKYDEVTGELRKLHNEELHL